MAEGQLVVQRVVRAVCERYGEVDPGVGQQPWRDLADGQRGLEHLALDHGRVDVLRMGSVVVVQLHHRVLRQDEVGRRAVVAEDEADRDPRVGQIERGRHGALEIRLVHAEEALGHAEGRTGREQRQEHGSHAVTWRTREHTVEEKAL